MTWFIAVFLLIKFEATVGWWILAAVVAAAEFVWFLIKLAVVTPSTMKESF